ncbi:hypothetical protein LDENG_00178460 [Lucifuga dentata]|nr:hypothetical protein LDENG_00178460 [Lucifuga dentata]
MDSFFKAAVCDLDKLLDDFELSSEELECKSVFPKPSSYPFSSLGSQCLPSESSSIPQSLPDLNSLHYGSTPSCPQPSISQNLSTDNREAKGQPLTGVDLLSSVDRGAAKNSAPPCPDRALKPVCDLVNDTSSALLVRANSHDAFSELDMVKKQMEEEEALLVDFESPVVSLQGEDVVEPSTGCRNVEDGTAELLELDSHEQAGAYSSSLSLLDVILPAAVERSCEPTDDSLLPQAGTSADKEEKHCEEVACLNQPEDDSLDHCEQEGALDVINDSTITEDEEDKLKEPLGRGEGASPVGLKTQSLDSEPVGLSCLPVAVSICGALVNPEDESEQVTDQGNKAEISESTEADSLSALNAREEKSCCQEPVNVATSLSQQTADDRKSPAGQRISLGSPAVPSLDLASTDRSEPSPVDPAEFGFEYLPESDQAELLVTDEELDAFLQAHAEAEQSKGVSYCNWSGECHQPVPLSESSGSLEDRLVEEELRSCVQGRREELEALASPESDRTICASVNESFNSGIPSVSQDSCTPSQGEPELSPGVNHPSTSNTCQSQHRDGPDPQASYGGARPKQLYCQTARSPPAGEVEDETQMLSGSFRGPSTSEDEENSPTSPNPSQDHPSIRDPSSIYAPQEQQEDSLGYDELSEPPPYPGESPRDDARPEDVEGLGSKQPAWVPDSEAPNCMNCWQRFTFTKRRHHCRACGKVYCTVCCNRKCKLKYLEKEARVCVVCFDAIHRAQALERMMSPTGPSPNPNVPSEYCSTIPPMQQARAAGTLNSPPPTVMVPVSVLKHPSNETCPREQKRVWFADGILPNGEVADTTKLLVSSRRSSQDLSGVTLDTTIPGSSGSEVGIGDSAAPETSEAVEVVRPPVSGPWDYALLCGIGSSVKRNPSLLPDAEEELPPLLITTGEDEAGDVLVEESPAPCQILHLLEEGGPRPLTFVLNANLLVNVKLVTCCSRQCWLFGSNGLQALGQRELVFLLECLPEEKTLPKDLFTLYLNIYQDAQKGKFVEDMGNVTFTSSFLGSKEHGGMLFFSPTCQPLDGLTLPPQPFLFGLLIQKLEVPWAKVFPLRLLLRLGAEVSGVWPSIVHSQPCVCLET